jgi:hypothetical protein
MVEEGRARGAGERRSALLPRGNARRDVGENWSEVHCSALSVQERSSRVCLRCGEEATGERLLRVGAVEEEGPYKPVSPFAEVVVRPRPLSLCATVTASRTCLVCCDDMTDRTWRVCVCVCV